MSQVQKNLLLRELETGVLNHWYVGPMLQVFTVKTPQYPSRPKDSLAQVVQHHDVGVHIEQVVGVRRVLVCGP